MASPFFWAGEMAIDVMNRPEAVPIGWAVLWTVTWAVGSGSFSGPVSVISSAGRPNRAANDRAGPPERAHEY